MSPKSALPEWFAKAHSCLMAGDIDGFMSMYAPDAVHEFPWAPENQVRRLEGREAIAAYMSQLPGRIEFGRSKMSRCARSATRRSSGHRPSPAPGRRPVRDSQILSEMPGCLCADLAVRSRISGLPRVARLTHDRLRSRARRSGLYPVQPDRCQRLCRARSVQGSAVRSTDVPQARPRL